MSTKRGKNNELSKWIINVSEEDSAESPTPFIATRCGQQLGIDISKWGSTSSGIWWRNDSCAIRYRLIVIRPSELIIKDYWKAPKHELDRSQSATEEAKYCAKFGCPTATSAGQLGGPVARCKKQRCENHSESFEHSQHLSNPTKEHARITGEGHNSFSKIVLLDAHETNSSNTLSRKIKKELMVPGSI
nr:Toll/interleukin-1 receptor homology (TIR) domain-containing protein [Tanacetum cinerariifolium]